MNEFFAYYLKKKASLSQRDLSADGGTRTRTPLGTSSEVWRVYQFHHIRNFIYLLEPFAQVPLGLQR